VLRAALERFQPKARKPCGGGHVDILRIQFIKIHRTLRVTPAMAAGVTTRLWEVADLVALLETAESKKAA